MSEKAISIDESKFLASLASKVRGVDAVDIGGTDGSAAIAIVRGLKTNPRSKVELVAIADEFEGSERTSLQELEREEFYESVLSAGCVANISRIDLPKKEIAQSWKKPLDLLAINCSRPPTEVQTDIDLWEPFLREGAAVIFYGVQNLLAGLPAYISSLENSGKYRRLGSEGRVIALSRIPPPGRAYFAARVAAAGYAEDFALSRLAYGSFVSLEKRYIYLETPKAACTAIKHLLLNIENISFNARARPYFRETRFEMMVHQRKHVAIPSLLDLQDHELEAALMDPAWLRFAVVRHPMSRLVSTFENKVRVAEPGYQEAECRYKKIAERDGIRQSFAAYVNDISADNSYTADGHLQPQSQLLLIGLIPYSQIFRFEELGEALRLIGTHMGGSVSLPTFNRSPKFDWRSYYDSETAKKAEKMYEKDFSTFNYNPEEWKTDTSNAPTETSEATYWRSEVIARNAVIDFLYDSILGKRK